MKKLSFTLAVLLLATTGFAQFTFGPKAALNFSGFYTGIDELKSEMKPGFHAGLFFRFGGRLHVQPELLYAFKSSNIEESFSQAKNSIKTETSSIDIPVLLGYKLVNTRSVNFRLFAGPRVAMVVKDNFKTTYKSTRFNYAGQFGLGVDVYRLTIDLRYDYFFNTTVKHENGERLHFNVVQLSVGWKIL
jgi:hypothetical protein